MGDGTVVEHASIRGGREAGTKGCVDSRRGDEASNSAHLRRQRIIGVAVSTGTLQGVNTVDDCCSMISRGLRRGDKVEVELPESSCKCCSSIGTAV